MTSEKLFHYFPDLTAQQKQQFEQLPELYNFWNSQINVISRKDIDELFNRPDVAKESEKQLDKVLFKPWELK